MESATFGSLASVIAAAIPLCVVLLLGMLKLYNPKSMTHSEVRKRLRRLF